MDLTFHLEHLKLVSFGDDVRELHFVAFEQVPLFGEEHNDSDGLDG